MICFECGHDKFVKITKYRAKCKSCGTEFGIGFKEDIEDSYESLKQQREKIRFELYGRNQTETDG